MTVIGQYTLGFKSLYGFAGLLFTVVTACMVLIHPQPLGQSRMVYSKRRLFANYPFLCLVALIFAAMLTMYISVPLTPNYLRSTYQLGLDTLGAFGALTATGSILLNLTLGRLRPQTAFLLTQMSMALSTGLQWLGTGPAWFGLASLLVGALRTTHFLVAALVVELYRGSRLARLLELQKQLPLMVIRLPRPLQVCCTRLPPLDLIL